LTFFLLIVIGISWNENYSGSRLNEVIIYLCSISVHQWFHPLTRKTLREAEEQ
jgi:hypothetical protein